MGKIAKYSPRAKLIIGLIYNDEAIYSRAKARLQKKFGRIDFESGPIDFNFTDYYQAEMGNDLKRRFISFSKMIFIQELYRIKLFTNRLESRFSADKRRKVNIDPGYLDQAKLVLASTKDYAHRIFLRKGIFAEITLNYRQDTFTKNPWTYPDYCSREYIEIFNRIRNTFLH